MKNIQKRVLAINRISRQTLIAAAIIGIGAIFHLLHSLGFELHPDEAYYWMWSRHLDLSYYDQGPGIAYFIRLFTTLMGENLFALRTAAAVASAGSLLLLYLTAKELEFAILNRAAAIAGGFLIPGFFGGSFLIMHDSALLLFWTTSLYLAVRFIRRRETALLYWLFACIGMGGLSKYTMIFFAVSLTLWFVSLPSEYRLLRNPHLYGAALLAALIVSPVFLWNAQHNWDGFTAVIHLRSAGGESTGGAKPSEYLLGQILSVSPIWYLMFLFISIAGIFRHAIGAIVPVIPEAILKRLHRIEKPLGQKVQNSARKGLRDFGEREKAELFVFINAIVLPLFFLILSGSKIIQPNWVFPSYPAMVLLLVSGIRPGRRLYSGLLFLGLLFAIPLDLYAATSIRIASLIESLSGKRVSSYYIPEYRFSGFEQIISEIDSFRAQVDPAAGFAATRYQDSAIASFYLPGRPFVPSINVLQRNQYSYWPGLENGKNYLIFYIQEDPTAKSYLFFQPVLKYMFDEIRPYPEREIIRDGRVIKRYQIWHARRYRAPWDRLLIDYILQSAIFDVMPNLRGRPDERAVRGENRDTKRFVEDLFLSKGGELKGSSDPVEGIFAPAR
jgi:4-amino-4-deoxy-L-arabinose transferase-like glycosyltransferase